MNWNNPDAYPGESEEEYAARKENERRHNPDSDFIFGMIILFFNLARMAALLGLFVFIAYSVSKKLFGNDADAVKIWGSTVVFTYLIFCIVFFLKGTIIGLRTKRNSLWILPWIICVSACCLIPASMIKHLTISLFPFTERETTGPVIMGWAAFLISACYLYTLYRFKTPNSPRIFNWIFRLGYKAGRFSGKS